MTSSQNNPAAAVKKKAEAAKKREEKKKAREVTQVETNKAGVANNKKIQNKPPKKVWASFEACWRSCVKNGNKLLMESCKAHVKARGHENDQDHWIDDMKHFGLKVEQ